MNSKQGKGKKEEKVKRKREKVKSKKGGINNYQ
jgi:hypothetical protein